MGTYVTCRNIIFNGFPRLWLLEIPQYKLHGFVEAKMSYNRKVITGLGNSKSTI
jgi:hypothetical protein